MKASPTWCLLAIVFVVFFNTGSVSSTAYRIIVNKLPLLPESNTPKDGIFVRNSTECQVHCKDSRNFLFAKGRGGLRCLCSNESKPFRYGLVNSPGAVFKSEVRDVRGIDFYVYLGYKPVEISEISVTDIEKVKSLDTCALLCYNNEPLFCSSFSYDVGPLALQPCRLYGLPKMGTRYEEIAQNSSLLYFAYSGSFLTKFSRQWGLVDQTSKNTRSNLEQWKTSKWEHPYSLPNLDTCAAYCYERLERQCDHIYYDIAKKNCFINRLPTGVNSSSTFVPKILYLRQDRTKDCSAAPPATSVETGEFRSPGFPYSYDTEPCSWRFLTPWGKALSLQLNTAEPKRSVCKETIQINNASSRICQIEKQIVGQSDNGLNTVELKPSDTTSNGIAFVAAYESVWACRPGGKQLLLKGPGSIATKQFPSNMASAICRWKISAGSAQRVKIEIRYFDFQSEPMLRSATLTFSDAKGKSLLCNSTNACKGQTYNFTSPVDIDFQSGTYFRNPKGFKLFYDFSPVFPKPDLIDTQTWEISGKAQNVQVVETDLQLRRQVNVTYKISNTIMDPQFMRIALTLNTVFISEHRKGSTTHSSACIYGGYMNITDPFASYTYIFCNHEENGTVIVSNGNSLIVNVVMPPQAHLPSTIPSKGFNFSITSFKDPKKIYVQLNSSSSTFTSPNYPNSYPPNEIIEWGMDYPDGKRIAVLSFLDIKLGRYQVLTNTFCNNDVLAVNIEGKPKVINCSITQEELPLRFVQHGVLAVGLKTSEHYLGSGFKANVQYYNKVGCNTTKDPVIIKGPGPILSAQYDESTTGPCEWMVDTDLLIDCLEGCSLVEYIEPWAPYSSTQNLKSNIAFKGTIIRSRGNERIKWFSATVSEIGASTSKPATRTPSTTKQTNRPTITSNPSSIPGRKTTQHVLHNGTSTAPTGSISSSSHRGSLSAGAIVGIVFGVLFFLIIIVVVTLLLLRRSPHDTQMFDSIRSSFANFKNPFVRRAGDTASPYKSFVDDDSTHKKEDIVVKFHKEGNEGGVYSEAIVPDRNVSSGHQQINGGFYDIGTAEA